MQNSLESAKGNRPPPKSIMFIANTKTVPFNSKPAVGQYLPKSSVVLHGCHLTAKTLGSVQAGEGITSGRSQEETRIRRALIPLGRQRIE
jgi:hypothetical protein